MSTDLADLKFHWGSAYAFQAKAGLIMARRRDTNTILVARDVEAMLEKIRDDYASNPVPRTVHYENSDGS